MDETPWQVVDLLDPDKPVKRYATDHEAYIAHQGEAVDIIYRPRKRKVKRNG